MSCYVLTQEWFPKPTFIERSNAMTVPPLQQGQKPSGKRRAERELAQAEKAYCCVMRPLCFGFGMGAGIIGAYNMGALGVDGFVAISLMCIAGAIACAMVSGFSFSALFSSFGLTLTRPLPSRRR